MERGYILIHLGLLLWILTLASTMPTESTSRVCDGIRTVHERETAKCNTHLDHTTNGFHLNKTKSFPGKSAEEINVILSNPGPDIDCYFYKVKEEVYQKCCKGWTSSIEGSLLCDIDTSGCESNPCQNGGACVHSDGSYTCQCPAEWTGHGCHIDVNECLMNPCKNDATCVNTEGSYICQCTPGWSGTTCNEDTSGCESNPCQNGGKCVNSGGSYTCQCPPEWTGHGCRIDVNECLMNPCKNGATCVNKDGSYTCQCKQGWSGTTCNEGVSSILKHCYTDNLCSNSNIENNNSPFMTEADCCTNGGKSWGFGQDTCTACTSAE